MIILRLPSPYLEKMRSYPAAERTGRSRRWTTRARASIRANRFMGMVALAGDWSITNALNVNWTGGDSQAFWDPLVETPPDGQQPQQLIVYSGGCQE